MKVAALLVLLGCEPLVHLPFPTDVKTGTEILSFSQGDRIEYHAIDLSSGTLRTELDLGDTAQLEAIIVSETPEQLAIAPGPFVPPAEGETWRPIPGTFLSSHRAIVEDRAGIWSEASTTSLALASVRMPGLDLMTCLDHGGCRAGPASCVIPCPLPAVATPTAPMPARTWTCNMGFTTSIDGMEACAPWPNAQRLPCTEPTSAHFVGTSGCEPILTPCPASGYSPDLPTDRPIVFASDTPSLIAALGSVPEGGIVAISPGEYGEIQLGDQTIFGTCPDNTSIERITVSGSAQVIRVSAGSLQISGVLTLRESMVAGGVQGSGTFDAERTLFRGDVEAGSGVLDQSVVFGALRLSGSLDSKSSDHVAPLSVGGGRTEIELGAMGSAQLDGDTHLDRVWISLDGPGVRSTAELRAEYVALVGRTDTALRLEGTSRVTDLHLDVLSLGGPRPLVSITGTTRIVRARLRHDHCFGMHITARGVELSDVDLGTHYTTLSSTVACDGIQVDSEAEVRIDRIAITGAGGRGIDVRGTLTAFDVDILDPGRVRSDVEARGIHVSSVMGEPIGNAEITRLRIDGAEAAGLNARNGIIRAADVSIFRSRPRVSIDDTGSGDAFGAYQAGILEVDRFLAQDNAGAGAIVFTTAEGGLTLRRGTFRGNASGIHLDNPSYDFCRLLDRVVFDDTGNRFDPPPPESLDCR